MFISKNLTILKNVTTIRIFKRLYISTIRMSLLLPFYFSSHSSWIFVFWTEFFRYSLDANSVFPQNICTRLMPMIKAFKRCTGWQVKKGAHLQILIDMERTLFSVRKSFRQSGHEGKLLRGIGRGIWWAEDWGELWILRNEGGEDSGREDQRVGRE